MLEQMLRVPQPPKMRKTFAGPKGAKSTKAEKIDRFIKLSTNGDTLPISSKGVPRLNERVSLKEFGLFFVFYAEVLESYLCGKSSPRSPLQVSSF